MSCSFSTNFQQYNKTFFCPLL